MTQVVQKARASVREYTAQARIKVVPAAENWNVSAAADSGLSKTYRHLLVLRFAVFNLAASALLGTAYAQGWRKKGWVALGRNRIKIRDCDALQQLVDTELDG